MREVIYRPRAAADLEDIARYSKETHGERQAKTYLQDIQKKAELAADLPGLGANLSGLPEQYRRLQAARHRLIYRYDNNRLIVVRILHERQELPPDLDVAEDQ